MYTQPSKQARSFEYNCEPCIYIPIIFTTCKKLAIVCSISIICWGELEGRMSKQIDVCNVYVHCPIRVQHILGDRFIS